jgi:hypothetical protein
LGDYHTKREALRALEYDAAARLDPAEGEPIASERMQLEPKRLRSSVMRRISLFYQLLYLSVFPASKWHKRH